MKIKRTLTLICLLIVIGLIYISILQYKIWLYNHKETPKSADYLIVLGARVKGTVTIFIS